MIRNLLLTTIGAAFVTTSYIAQRIDSPYHLYFLIAGILVIGANIVMTIQSNFSK